MPSEIDEWPLPVELHRVEKLLSNEGGLIKQVAEISEPTDSHRIFVAAMGRLEDLHPNIRKLGVLETGSELSGTGGDSNPRLARAIAVVEALERYSSCVPVADLRWDAFRDVRDIAVDIERLPSCSEAEVSRPDAAAARFDANEPIRWTWAKSITDESLALVPAVLVWLHTPPLTASERAWMQVSTGCAAHTDIASALINGICEVIERDSIALTWLQQLPLPKLVFDPDDEELAEILEQARATGRRYTFFDATTDVGVPTVYCVDDASEDTRLRHVVMCATDLDPRRALRKIIRETISSRVALRDAAPPPADVDDFHSVFHGATFMGHPERAHAFRFLLDSDTPARKFEELTVAAGAAPADRLSWLLDRLRSAGCTVYAVNITTEEARRAGIHVIRVIIPELQPLSFVHKARYLRHERLYAAPTKMGYTPHQEADLNVFPQPFA